MSAGQIEKRPCPIEHSVGRSNTIDVPEPVQKEFLAQAHTFSTENSLWVCPEKLFTLAVSDTSLLRSYHGYIPEPEGKNSFILTANLHLFQHSSGRYRLGRLRVNNEKFKRYKSMGISADGEFIDFSYDDENDPYRLTYLTIKSVGHRDTGELETYGFGYNESGLQSVHVSIGVLDPSAQINLRGEIWDKELTQLLAGETQHHQANETLTFGDWRNINGKLRVENDDAWLQKHYVELKAPTVLDLSDVTSIFFSPETLMDPFLSSHEADKTWSQTSIFTKLGIEWKVKEKGNES